MHPFASRLLVQAVHVLRDDVDPLPAPFELGENLVGRVRPCAPKVHLAPVKREEDLRIVVEALPTQQIFRFVPRELRVLRVLRVLFRIQPVGTSEIGNSRLGRDPRPAEEGDSFAFVHHLPEEGEPLLERPFVFHETNLLSLDRTDSRRSPRPVFPETSLQVPLFAPQFSRAASASSQRRLMASANATSLPVQP